VNTTNTKTTWGRLRSWVVERDGSCRGGVKGRALLSPATTPGQRTSCQTWGGAFRRHVDVASLSQGKTRPEARPPCTDRRGGHVDVASLSQGRTRPEACPPCTDRRGGHVDVASLSQGKTRTEARPPCTDRRGGQTGGCEPWWGGGHSAGGQGIPRMVIFPHVTPLR